MINRVLIRLKIVQIIYAYYQNGGKIWILRKRSCSSVYPKRTICITISCFSW